MAVLALVEAAQNNPAPICVRSLDHPGNPLKVPVTQRPICVERRIDRTFIVRCAALQAECKRPDAVSHVIGDSCDEPIRVRIRIERAKNLRHIRPIVLEHTVHHPHIRQQPLRRTPWMNHLPIEQPPLPINRDPQVFLPSRFPTQTLRSRFLRVLTLFSVSSVAKVPVFL